MPNFSFLRNHALDHGRLGNGRPPSPLALELDPVVRIIAASAVVVGLVFLAIALLVGISFAAALFFAIGVMVALVPEGLLPTVTVSLAIGAQRMARDTL